MDADTTLLDLVRALNGFDEARESLGLVATPHDLRRTCGSLARMAGADLRFIQKAMRHGSITTTVRIYGHLHDDELDAVAAALVGLGKGRPTGDMAKTWPTSGRAIPENGQEP